MRLRLKHKLTFAFPEPVRGLTQILRLTPRSHEGQRVISWRIDVEPDCMLRAGEDHFGNLIHTLTVPGSATDVRIAVTGEIVNFDQAGVVRGTAERLPAELFLRETSLTTADAALRDFARDVTAADHDPIAKLHLLMGAAHEAIALDEAESPPASAADIFAARRGTARAQAHVFIACARHLGWPARCVTGYYAPDGRQHRRHAWAEVHVPVLGWVGFDLVHDLCPQDEHIRMAVGLDALDGASIRCTRMDGLTEDIEVTWLQKRDPEPAAAQVQSAT